MVCSVPHTYDQIKSMVEKQIQEDRGRQLAIMNLGHEFDNACTSKDELRKAYEECRDIPLEQCTLIENFLKIESDKDYEMHNALFRNAAKLEKQIINKIIGPITTKEKVQKKNDVKARSMLLLALPNEHLMSSIRTKMLRLCLPLYKQDSVIVGTEFKGTAKLKHKLKVSQNVAFVVIYYSTIMEVNTDHRVSTV
ncbi:hypothetical protein Tco_0983952 [Tanacetum coccineum]